MPKAKTKREVDETEEVDEVEEIVYEFTQKDWDEYMRSGNTTGIVKSFIQFLEEKKD